MVNATKKTILLLSMISLNGSMFGMLNFDNVQKKISTLVLSQKQQVATAVLVPLAAAGCYLLAQHKDEISSLLEKIPMPSEKVILGLAGAVAVPTTYVLAGKFRPEEQFQLYHHNYAGIQQHLMLQNKKVLAQFVAGQEKVQFNSDEAPTTLLQFINNNFSDEVNNGLYASIKAADQLCDLERRIRAEILRVQHIADAGTVWVAVEKEKNILTISPTEELEKLQKDVLFIQKLRGIIVDLPEYNRDKKIRPAIKKNQLTAEQITFSSKIAAFIPLFIQPVSLTCLILLQSVINKLGLPYRVL